MYIVDKIYYRQAKLNKLSHFALENAHYLHPRALFSMVFLCWDGKGILGQQIVRLNV